MADLRKPDRPAPSLQCPMSSGMESLTAPQRELVEQWLPGAEPVRDHSWGLVGTTVLELSQGGVRYIVKAGDERDHHLERELRAHRLWLEPWTSRGLAPQLLRSDDEAKLLRALEAAFIEGYGSDPREPGAWRRNRIREAVGTAAWAYQVGDEAFERQGHRMIAEALAG